MPGPTEPARSSGHPQQAAPPHPLPAHGAISPTGPGSDAGPVPTSERTGGERQTAGRAGGVQNGAPRLRAAASSIPAAEEIRERWNRIAADFDRFATPLALRLGEEVLERAGARRGMHFLDVAAGSGALSLPAARRGARVLATDISPAMVDRLLVRARAEGLVDLAARVMDGCALDLEDDCFDLTASQNGVSVFADFARGLAEMVRVTRPGGEVVIVSFGSMREAEFLSFFLGAMRAVVPGFTGLAADPPPLPFQLADPEKLRRRMEEAGLYGVRVEQTTWEMPFASGRHLWDAVTSSNPIATRLVADLPRDERDEVQRVLDGMLRERSGSAGGVLRNTMNVGIGTK